MSLKVVVYNNDGVIVSSGFDVIIKYIGTTIAPSTREVHVLTRRKTARQMGHLGLDANFNPINSVWATLCARHRDVLVTEGTKLNNWMWNYRNNLDQKDQKRNNLLGDAFWYQVYNNPMVSLDDLKEYLITYETNPVLRKLVSNGHHELDFIYA